MPATTLLPIAALLLLGAGRSAAQDPLFRPYVINSTDATSVPGGITGTISIPANPAVTADSPNQVLFGLYNAFRADFPTTQEGYFFQDLFAIAPAEIGPGGNLSRWNIGNNPALYGQGVAQSLVTFNPCGINLPHVHPRGLEFIHVLYGELTLTLVEENNGRVVSNTLGQGNSFFVPQGFLHTEHNNPQSPEACLPAAFMNTFTGVDPGTSTMNEALFRLPIDALQTSLGNADLSVVNDLVARISSLKNLALGPPACIARCYPSPPPPVVSVAPILPCNSASPCPAGDYYWCYAGTTNPAFNGCSLDTFASADCPAADQCLSTQ